MKGGSPSDMPLSEFDAGHYALWKESMAVGSDMGDSFETLKDCVSRVAWELGSSGKLVIVSCFELLSS